MVLQTRVVALLLFGSGFCALIYQTTWLREFRLIFGASTAASAAVLGVFMAGLGLGGIILGQRSERKARPLAFYAQLEALIAASVALSPLLISAARHFYIALGGTESMGIPLSTAIRLVFAMLILGAPTFLMGGTLPAAVRAVVTRNDLSRRSVGMLYGANTLGAVTGVGLGTFYLFENFGNRLTLWWAVALNAVVAVSAFHFSKLVSESGAELNAPWELENEEPRGATNRWFVFAAAGLAGFAFFLMEIVWYRMLGPLLGGSTFSFGIILGIALLGIGLGGVTYALFDLKRSASLWSLAMTCAVEALFIALPYALGDRIAITTMLLRPLGTLGFHGHVIAWAALCSIVVFPAAFVSGLQFPLLIALLGKGTRGVGSQTGAAYAWNTIGALIGSLAGGFGFIPIFSAPGVWRLVIVLLSVLALVAACLSVNKPGSWTRSAVPFSIGGLALAMLAATGPTAFWRHGQIGVGRLRIYHSSPNELRDLVYSIRRNVMWEKDGIESSVALQNADSLSFIVNGRSDGNARTDAGTQVMCGLVGAALHPHPEKAMVVGLGTGSTAGWLADIPTMRLVDVVELEPAILKVAAACAPVNRNALANPKLHVIIGDGRELLLTIRDKFDLIVSEPSNPYRAGVAGLFTREFYQSVEQRLNSGGIFLQWIQAYDIDDRTIEILYRTLGSVFNNIESWQTQAGDILLAASREPVQYDADALRRRLATEPLKSGLLGAWNADGLEDFLAHYVGDNAITKALQNLEERPLNTDDRTVIEFACARSVSAPNGFQIANLRKGAHAAGCDRPQFVRGKIDWTRVDESRAALFPNSAEDTSRGMTGGQRNRVAAFCAYMRGDFSTALQLWRSQSEEPRSVAQLACVAESLAAQGHGAAEIYIQKLAAIRPTDAEAIRALFYWKQGRVKEAVGSLEEFFCLARQDPWPDHGLVERSIALAETIANNDPGKETALSLYNALLTPLSVWNANAHRKLAMLAIAMHLDGHRLGDYTARAVEEFEPNIIWDRGFLQARTAAYAAVGGPLADQAAHDLDEFMQREPLTTDISAFTREIEIASGEKKTGFGWDPPRRARSSR